jgi:hypothetical protein
MSSHHDQLQLVNNLVTLTRLFTQIPFITGLSCLIVRTTRLLERVRDQNTERSEVGDGLGSWIPEMNNDGAEGVHELDDSYFIVLA